MAGLLAVFSLAHGVCSVAAKDVLGKTVSKSRRGRLTGLAGSVAGLVTLGVAAGLMLYSALAAEREPGDAGLFAVLLAGSVAHQGARIGRKTYLVDMADSGNRASYTAVSNTVVGLLGIWRSARLPRVD